VTREVRETIDALPRHLLCRCGVCGSGDDGVTASNEIRGLATNLVQSPLLSRYCSFSLRVKVHCAHYIPTTLLSLTRLF
jgi:hypothetical protein